MNSEVAVWFKKMLKRVWDNITSDVLRTGAEGQLQENVNIRLSNLKNW